MAVEDIRQLLSMSSTEGCRRWALGVRFHFAYQLPYVLGNSARSASALRV
jgi:hypothetical protein